MPTITLSDLQNRVYSRLDSNTLLYPSAEVTSAINECIRVFNLVTGMTQSTLPVGTGFTEAGRLWYNVPSGILIPMRMQFEDRWLQKFFPNQIGKAYSTWTYDTTANTGLPVSEWVPCGLSKFAIHPADSAGGGALFMTGVAEPALLVSGSDTVVIPNEYTDCLVLLAAQILTLKETGALFKQSSMYYQDFLRLAKKATLWRGLVQPKYYLPETIQRS